MVRKVYDWLDRNFERYIMATLMAMIVCLMMLDVISRYFFNSSLAFPQELSRYSMLYITFFGIGYGVRYNAHLCVDVLPALVPKSRLFFSTFGDVSMVVFGSLLAYYGIGKLQNLIDSAQTSTAMRLPMWIVYLGLEIGWGLTLLRIIQKYILMFYRLKKTGRFENPYLKKEEHTPFA